MDIRSKVLVNIAINTIFLLTAGTLLIPLRYLIPVYASAETLMIVWSVASFIHTFNLMKLTSKEKVHEKLTNVSMGILLFGIFIFWLTGGAFEPFGQNSHAVFLPL